MDPLPCWVAVALATLATALISLILGALRSYSLARFEQLLERQPKRMEQLQTLLADEAWLAVTLTGLRGLAVSGGLVALTGGWIARALASGPPPVGPWGWSLVGAQATGIGLLLFVLLGNVMPLTVGEHRAETVLVAFLPTLRLLRKAGVPFGWLFAGLATVTLRVANVRAVEKEEELKDDILSAALAGESEGVIDETARDVIENLMEFRDVAVTEVMTPRIEIASVEASDDLSTLVEKALSCEMSRIPVTDGSLDKIVGVLMVKDLLRAFKEPNIDPRSLFRKPIFVPATKRVADLLKELRHRKVHMAIVADEYGGTAGLVTIEDLIEELIGDIHDEHDKPDVPIRRISEHEIDVDAKLHIDELNEELGTGIPEDEDVETLGGFMALQLGRIPRQGDKVVLNGTSFTVIEADERRAARVLIRTK